MLGVLPGKPRTVEGSEKHTQPEAAMRALSCTSSQSRWPRAVPQVQPKKGQPNKCHKHSERDCQVYCCSTPCVCPQHRCVFFFFSAGNLTAVSLLRACSVMIPNRKSVILAGFVSFQWTTLCTGRRRAPAFFVQVPWKGDIPAHGRHRARREQRTPLFSAAEKADTTRQVMVLCSLNVCIPILSRGYRYTIAR